MVYTSFSKLFLSCIVNNKIITKYWINFNGTFWILYIRGCISVLISPLQVTIFWFLYFLGRHFRKYWFSFIFYVSILGYGGKKWFLPLPYIGFHFNICWGGQIISISSLLSFSVETPNYFKTVEYSVPVLMIWFTWTPLMATNFATVKHKSETKGPEKVHVLRVNRISLILSRM